ncbi:efflux RND transporter periplasmic adaptor subunit [Desulfosediminicola flagellatus]|uniref:efflux RND transporter periplasmic adaptor subunit n=1 Tax=Desulfosediminicola flagellatus TaxID=2569541 RepID=UPI0010AC6188|nr:efflux RND transporter periplasmic adaptor subunit [Desulfosediminicola flagellatus]
MIVRFCRLLFIPLVAFVISGCSEEKDTPIAPQEPPPLPVEVIILKAEKVPVWIEYTGKTEATKRVEVTARVAGRLEKALFKEGEYVNEGDILFVVEKAKYQAALAQAEAQLERNRATLTLAMKDVERYKPLVADGLAPRATLEQYQAKVAELNASIKSDEANVRDAELNLSYTEIVAPISGRISRTLVDVGNVVGYNQQTVLTTIVGDDPMYAYFNPTESQVQIMRQYKSQDEMDAVVRVPGNVKGLLDRSDLKGKVNFSDNRVDRMTGTISMRAEVANPDHSLLEGTFVYVEIMVTDQKELLLIPPAAVSEDQRSSFVYVVDENSLAKRVDIKRGYENRHYLMVTEGLQGGESVVISGLTKIMPGRKLAATDVTETKGVLARLAEQGMLGPRE